MDLDLFSSLLRNLLHTGVLSLPAEGGDLTEFEEKFCYDPALQPLFTAGNLSRLLADVEDGVLCEMEDELGVCVLFFRFADRNFVLGPFVRREFSEEQVRVALMRDGVPGSYISSVRLYYSAFPQVSFTHARSTVTACVHAFAGPAEYSVCRIDETLWKEKPPQRGYDRTLDYSSVYRRYDAENRFLRLVQEGDVERVLIAFREMNMQGMDSKRYVNAVYTDPAIGLSMIRALVRKAAEQGGASVIEIDEITQRAVQKIVSARSQAERLNSSNAMILELTEAVRRAREQKGRYSPPIQRVVGYLRLNYSQEIPLAKLAELAHFSGAYLSRQFRKEVRTTITDYVARLRCNQAARLLRESGAAVQDIAAYVGYGDNNYFTKVFKKHYGVTPTGYREGKRAEADNMTP